MTLGRTLDEAAQNGSPKLPDPIAESQPTVAPRDETYSTRKAALCWSQSSSCATWSRARKPRGDDPTTLLKNREK